MAAAPYASSFAAPQGESLALLELPCPEIETLARTRARRFEYSCRGDRVRLDLLAPDAAPADATPSSGAAPAPTLLVQPNPGDDVDLASLRGLRTWLSGGVAVASVTLPLFGSRRSPKLTAKLEAAVREGCAGRAISGTDRILWSEFTRQSVMELRRAIDALAELQRDPVLVFAGSGLAASVGAIFCAVDERPAAAVLAGLASHGPDGIAPSSRLADIAPRPVLALDLEEPELLDAAWPLLSANLAR